MLWCTHQTNTRSTLMQSERGRRPSLGRHVGKGRYETSNNLGGSHGYYFRVHHLEEVKLMPCVSDQYPFQFFADSYGSDVVDGLYARVRLPRPSPPPPPCKVPPRPTPKSVRRYCAYCGRKLPDRADECKGCGAPL